MAADAGAGAKAGSPEGLAERLSQLQQHIPAHPCSQQVIKQQRWGRWRQRLGLVCWDNTASSSCSGSSCTCKVRVGVAVKVVLLGSSSSSATAAVIDFALVGLAHWQERQIGQR